MRREHVEARLAKRTKACLYLQPAGTKACPGWKVQDYSDGRGAREYVGSEKSPVRYFVVGIVEESQQPK